MKNVYINLELAAELQEMSYNTMIQNIKRHPEDYDCRTEKNPKGGKDIKLVSLQSLSKKAQEAYEARQQVATQQERPWYVDTDYTWYKENHSEDLLKGIEKANFVREFLAYDDKHRTDYAEIFAAERFSCDRRTLYRYRQAFLEGRAWKCRLEKDKPGADYSHLEVLALCRKPHKGKGTFWSINEKTEQAIKNIWLDKIFASNLGTKQMLYEKLLEMQEAGELEQVPSLNTVKRYISYLMEDEAFYNAWYLAGRGTMEYKNARQLKTLRNTGSLKVMELIQGDEHTFDCWVLYRADNGVWQPIRPKLVAWIDTRSRMILGDVMCKDANSDILKQSLLKMIYSEPGGVPEYLYIDNGKDYTSKEMTGRPRTDRNEGLEKFESELEFDAMGKGFYQSIGIRDYHRALPYEPWTKGNIERFFGGVCNRFTRWMSSYTGTLTGSKTFAKVKKDIKGMQARGELITIEEFYSLWHTWVTEKYAHRRNGGLKKAGETYLTPYEVFHNEERYEKGLPPRSYAVMMLMRSEQVRVYNTGIHKFGQEYRCEELANYIGRTVDIKYDPYDTSLLYVMNSKTKKRVCEVQAVPRLGIGRHVDKKALAEHKAMQNRQLQHDRQKLAEARIPYYLINEDGSVKQPEGQGKVVGGIPDLMLGGTKSNKVVTLPEDKTYRRNGNLKRDKEEPAQASEYLLRRGAAATAKIEEIDKANAL